MRKIHIVTGMLLASAISMAHGQTIFNCSAFAPTGSCGVALNGLGGQAFQLANAPTGAFSGAAVNLIPGSGGGGHNGSGMIYQTRVNAQAFTSTFTFVPNGKNVAFVIENNTSAAGGGASNRPDYFAGGAGCEAGFFQAFTSGSDPEINNLFALELDQFSPLLNTAPFPYTFTYSSAMIYQASQSPCIPPYNGTHGTDFAPSKVSTSPVPLNNPAGTGLTTTGHTYSVTVSYDGTNVTLKMFDVTAGGSCPGATCFTNTWPVNIPALVGSNTAYVGLTAGTNSDAVGDLLIKSFSYAVNSLTPVTITPNIPTSTSITNDALLVMPGSTRQINVQIANGTLNTVNWSATTAGGATVTFRDPTHSGVSSISGALPTIEADFGGTGSACTQTPASGNTGPYTLSGGSLITITAQSVDDTSKTATFPFRMCSLPTATLTNGTSSVIVTPAYDQAYKTQKVTLQSWVVGCPDESGTWSIVTQPGGGDGALVDTTKRDTLFSATVTGRYVVRYTAACNGGTGNAIVYVSPNALPYAVTPEMTRPHECYVDPALTGADYEIGAGKAFTTISSTPDIATVTAGSIYRVWNTDLSGTSPSTFHEYFQIKQSGNALQPIVFCGVPDSLGNLPAMDGANATGQSGISTAAAAGLGVMSIWGGPPTPYGGWQLGSQGPSYGNIWGIHFKNATPANNYTPPGGGAPVAWQVGASCVNLRGGAYLNVSGNDMDTCTNGIFTAENGNSLWANVTQNVSVTGNHMQHSGWSTDSTEHQAYLQSYYLLFEGNRMDNYLNTASGSNVKWRGVEGIFRYNYLSGGPSRDFDLVDNQDAGAWVSLESYFTNVYPFGDSMGANGVAWYQESAQKDFVYGNVVYAGANTEYQVHYSSDHNNQMANKNGTLYAYNNTFPDAKVVFDTGSNGNGDNGFYQPRIWFANNIFWPANTVGVGSILAMQKIAPVILTGVTNLYQNGSMSITTPINGGNYNAGGATGWQAGCDTGTCPWPLTIPLNTHIYALTSGNYLTTGTLPYNGTTLIPAAGSAAIGAGTALSGAAALLPVRWNYNVTTGALTARLQPLTIGAEDSAAPAQAATPVISPTAGTYTSIQTISMSDSTTGAVIHYTLDGSTPTSGSPSYFSPFTINANTTIKAIAIASGFTDSAVATNAYTINLPGLWNSLAGWQTCILPGCDPGGTGIPVSTNQTIRNASPSLSGSSMQMSMVVNTNDTNALWSWFDSDCDLCTNFSSDFQVYLPSTSNLGALELDTAFLFSVALNREYMWGMQYCYQGAACPGGHNSWDVWDQNAIQWIDSGVTQAPIIGWNHIQTTNHRSGNNQVYDTFTLNGTLHTLNNSQPSGVLPGGWTSGTGFQFQLDAATHTGTQTFSINLDQAFFTATTVPTAGTPTFSPVAGSYGGTQSVTISASSGGVICYNTTGSPATNGSTGCTTGTLYTGPVSVATSETLYAVAGGTGFLDSSVGSAAYTITAPVVATPTFSPVAGTYTVTQTVTISDTTPASTIYYTTDGSTPTTGSAVYSTPLTVSTTTTVKAIAAASGYTNSAVGSALYTITAAPTPTVILTGTQSFSGNVQIQ